MHVSPNYDPVRTVRVKVDEPVVEKKKRTFGSKRNLIQSAKKTSVHTKVKENNFVEVPFFKDQVNGVKNGEVVKK